MRIVHVIASFMPDSVGGTENYVLGISKAMASRGNDVFVITGSRNGETRYDYEGIGVYAIGYVEPPTRKMLSMQQPGYGFSRFKEIIKEINPDVVHFHSFNWLFNTFHLKYVKERGIRTFFTPHQSGVFCVNSTMRRIDGSQCNGIVHHNRCLKCYLRHNGYSKITEVLLRLLGIFSPILSICPWLPVPPSSLVAYNRLREISILSKYADGVIAISRWVEKAFIGNGVRNVHLVEQGIDEGFLKEIPKRKESDDSILRIIFVGRVYHIKGLETFCRALENVDKTRIKVTFACVNPGDEYANRIKKYINSLPNHEWHENLSQKEIKDLMSRNDILILPSISEMSPLVVLEAFACRLPVLGSDIPPITDHVSDGINGVIFKCEDSESLRHTLLNLMDKCVSISVDDKKSITTLSDVSTKLTELYKK